MKIIDNKNVGISLLSSYNLYLDTMISTKTITGDDAKIVTHINSDEEYYAIKTKNFKLDTSYLKDDSKYFNSLISQYSINEKQKDKWTKIIEHPGNKTFMWPVDIISFLQSSECYMIYEFVPQSQYKSIATLSKESSFLGFENKSVRCIVLNLLEAFSSIDKNNFVYFGLDDDKIFVNVNDDSVLLPVYDLVLLEEDQNSKFVMRDYFSEVIDPYNYANRKISSSSIEEDSYLYDKKSELYAMNSILFRLLIGLYPYEGPYMAGYANNLYTDDNQDWIFKYVENPIFIFDDKDDSNSIRDYNENIPNVKRWNSLSDELRNMFIYSFAVENVMRSNSKYKPYTINEWIRAINNFFNSLD